jgi:hypothetical protein
MLVAFHFLFAAPCQNISRGNDKPAAPAAAASKRTPAIVTRVRFYPAPDRAQAMVGGKFSGSNVSQREGFVPLAEIRQAPVAKEWTELTFDNTKPFRWIRYDAPAGSRGEVAEIEFYDEQNKLGGAGFGPAGGFWRGALDGKPETWFNAPTVDGQYLGLDLGDRASTAKVHFDPGGGDFDKPRTVTLRCATPGATIRYTFDGTTPGPKDGEIYSSPIPIEKTSTLVAVAFSSELAASPENHTTYLVGPPVSIKNSFHVGNSLTGNAGKLPMYLRTAGRVENYEAFLIGGSFTVKLWNAKDTNDKERWEQTWAKTKLPLDFFTVQPRDFNIDEEVDHEIRFFNLMREKSPDVQPWIYAEWVEMDRRRPSDKGEVLSSQMSQTVPALTWEESMSAMLLYVEEVEQRVLAKYGEGKRPRIIPVSLAMGKARSMIDRGEIPGVAPGESSYYATLFEDQVHVNATGCYLVDLVWYAAMYGESPEGKLLPVATTLTAAQAAILQQLAWDVVKNYPDCGLFEEGSAPVGKPEFSIEPSPLPDMTPVMLKSSTPGAWFRYTLDGTTPTRTRGYVACGAVSVRPGMTLKAIAYKSGMADSEVATGVYPKP